MKHIRWIPFALLALASAATLVGLFHAVQAPPEPEWKGKKLREYLQAESRAELWQMSPECFPYMLMMMRARDAKWQFHLSRLLSKQTLVRFRPPPRPSYEGRWQAARAFAWLGTNAAPAVPGLCRLLTDCDTSSQASYALIRIDTVEATRAVEHALESKDSALRQTVSTHLGATRGFGGRFVPALLRGLNDTDDAVREHCARALGEIGNEPERVVPALVSHLTDHVPDVSRAAASALPKFGEQAVPAIPALVSIALNHDPTTYPAAVHALSKIDPEVAEFFPPTWTPASRSDARR